MQFAILVSVVVAIILSCFLLLTNTFNSFSVRSNQVLSNIENSNSGILYLLGHEDVIVDSTVVVIGDVPVSLSKTYWGSFEKVKSAAGKRSNRQEKHALLGAAEKKEATSIYLEDNDLPLVLAGNTRIEGNAYTPQNIIKPGNISGDYFQGANLVHGKRYSSERELPNLDLNWKNYISEMAGFLPGTEETVVELEDIKNSFSDKRIVVFENSKITLDQQLIGNIIIKSEKEIEVTSFAGLDQVLLMAPKVTVNPNFRGNLHIIAGEVYLRENVFFEYPSSVIVVQKPSLEGVEHLRYSPKISIGENSVFQGNIIYLDSGERRESKNDLLIEKGAMVEGYVYCEGYTELKGTVLGSIYTKYFMANQSGSIYINHIYNGKVLTEQIKPEMGGLLVEGRKKNIATWLY